MKRLLIAGLALGMVSATAMAADTDSATVALTATIASTCNIDLGGSGFAAFNPSSFDLSTQIDTTTALIAGGVTETAVTDAFCNDNSTTVSVTSNFGGLLATGAPTVAGSGSFFGDNGNNTATLTYSMAGDWEALPFATVTSTAAGAAAENLLTTNAVNGTLSLDITLDASGGLPVLAGSYADTITVTVLTGP